MELLTDLIKLVTAILVLAAAIEKRTDSTDGDDDLTKHEDR